jgi:hypothetical protein
MHRHLFLLKLIGIYGQFNIELGLSKMGDISRQITFCALLIYLFCQNFLAVNKKIYSYYKFDYTMERNITPMIKIHIHYTLFYLIALCMHMHINAGLFDFINTQDNVFDHELLKKESTKKHTKNVPNLVKLLTIISNKRNNEIKNKEHNERERKEREIRELSEKDWGTVIPFINNQEPEDISSLVDEETEKLLKKNICYIVDPIDFKKEIFSKNLYSFLNRNIDFASTLFFEIIQRKHPSGEVFRDLVNNLPEKITHSEEMGIIPAKYLLDKLPWITQLKGFDLSRPVPGYGLDRPFDIRVDLFRKEIKKAEEPDRKLETAKKFNPLIIKEIILYNKCGLDQINQDGNTTKEQLTNFCQEVDDLLCKNMTNSSPVIEAEKEDLRKRYKTLTNFINPNTGLSIEASSKAFSDTHIKFEE